MSFIVDCRTNGATIDILIEQQDGNTLHSGTQISRRRQWLPATHTRCFRFRYMIIREIVLDNLSYLLMMQMILYEA